MTHTLSELLLWYMLAMGKGLQESDKDKRMLNTAGKLPCIHDN